MLSPPLPHGPALRISPELPAWHLTRSKLFAVLPELEHLIRLQEIETRAADAALQVASAPARIAALDATLAAAQGDVAVKKQAIADNQSARRAVEKDLAVIQQRLSKYKDQLMEVKNNREYHAIQSEISNATAEVGRFEEQILERMVQADEQALALRAAEATLKSEEARVTAARGVIEAEAHTMQALLTELKRERDQVVAQISPKTVDLFYRISKGRNGVAVVPARDERCSECHVRLRPQVYYLVRRNEEIVQCDSCQRVLYFASISQPAPATPQ